MQKVPQNGCGFLDAGQADKKKRFGVNPKRLRVGGLDDPFI
jgi:hypothetical protein